MRPIYGKLEDFTWVCENMIPYHCDANSWSWKTFVTGFSSLGLLLVTSFISTNRSWCLVVRILCLIEFIAVFSDFFDIPVVGEFVQGSNIYRYGMFVSALTPIAFIILFLSARKSDIKELVLIGFGFIFFYLYLCSEYSVLSSIKLWIFFVFLFVYFLKFRDRISSNSIMPSGEVQRVLIRLSTLLLLAFIILTPFPNSHIQVDLESETSARGVTLRDSIPPGSVIASDPRMTWLRLESRRAVVVDCKYAPYGGPALSEYRQRMSELGGWNRACTGDSFRGLSAGDLNSFARKYSAKFILIDTNSELDTALQRFGWRVKIKIAQTRGFSSFPTRDLTLYSLQ
jgi:hypothetical protein